MEMATKQEAEELSGMWKWLKQKLPPRASKYISVESIVMWNISSLATWINACLLLWGTTGKAVFFAATTKVLLFFKVVGKGAKDVTESLIEAVLI